MDRAEKTLFAKQQLSHIWKCEPSVFDANENVFLESTDIFFEIVTFGWNAVIRGDKAMVGWCADRFVSVPAREIMDGDYLYDIDMKLRSTGKKLGGEHIRYLHLFPDKPVKKPDGFEYRWYDDRSVKELYDHRAFDNALNFERDVIAFAAYAGGEIAALAGADDYMNDLWQIGIDTAIPYRNRGLGMYLVKEIALEIERKGKVPFYNTWSPNIASTRVALGAGFYPVWMGYPCNDL